MDLDDVVFSTNSPEMISMKGGRWMVPKLVPMTNPMQIALMKRTRKRWLRTGKVPRGWHNPTNVLGYDPNSLPQLNDKVVIIDGGMCTHWGVIGFAPDLDLCSLAVSATATDYFTFALQ
jgi:hypothetical protein